jgi:predicted permease
LNPNWHMFSFAVAAALATGILFGIMPALRASRVDPGPALKEGKGTVGTAKSLLSRMLVAAQVTLALLLTTGAGLMVRTLVKLEAVEPGFRTSGTYLIDLDDSSSPHEGHTYGMLCRRIQQRVAALTGVASVSFSQMNFGGGRWVSHVRPASVANPADATLLSDGNRVDNGFFQTLSMPLLAGRTFTDADTAKSEEVAVVNEELAKKLYPEGGALGQIMKIGERDSESVRIVGIVKTAHYGSLREKPRAMFYVSSAQKDEYGSLVVSIDSNRAGASVLDRIRGIIHEEDPNLAISSIVPLGALVNQSMRQEKLLARLAGFLGAAALLLAAIGLYGILAYSVSQRTSEIGIRMALGAQPRTVEGMILRESMMVVMIGAAIGIPLTLACGRLIQSVLYGIDPGDIATIAGASALMLVVALAASLLPARRAARLDPLVALRNE